jgi:hypothetical protein
MDMALELGSSISSLDARMQNRMKNSMIDGSFMVVPPGSQSYMSSSMWGSGHNNIPNSSNNTANNSNSRPPNVIGTAGVRARANRVQNVSLGASVTPASRAAHHPTNMGGAGGGAQVIAAAPLPKSSALGLESSWWGNTSTSGASQILASSVMSGVIPYDHGPIHSGGHHPQQANTKQVMRLMDSLKTLGEENATLLREVEDAEAARMEAKAAREQMKRFKADYGKRFATLRAALEKFRREHSDASNANSGTNPVNGRYVCSFLL